MPVIYRPTGKALEYAELALNLYDGCSHGCTYCYAPSVCRKDRVTFHSSPSARKDIVERTALEAAELDPTSIPPILLCFTSDPYQPLEDTAGVTREVIEVLKTRGFRVKILTKGGTRACRDYDLLDQNDSLGATLTFLNREDSLKWEPGGSIPADRIASLHAAHARGIQTWVSLEPVIDPEQTLELIRVTHEFVDLYKVGKWNHDKRAAAIDWKAFGEQAINLLQELGKKYYIKKDLRKYLDPVIIRFEGEVICPY